MFDSDWLEAYYSKIKTLNSTIWEQRVDQSVLDGWMSNFVGKSGDRDLERLHALHLLSQFSYFADREIRALLVSLFQDFVRYPLVERARQANNDTTDTNVLSPLVQAALARTRYLGLGNPSESGTHLLYYFRQENRLNKGLFLHTHQLFDRRITDSKARLADPTVERLVFLDDFCGSGDQAIEYGHLVLSAIGRITARDKQTVASSYVALFGTETGLGRVRTSGLYDSVNAVYELDATHKCFANESRYFADAGPGIVQSFAEQMCRRYGRSLFPHHPLGYKAGQLLLGFHHNVPDNTLPVIWGYEDGSDGWFSAFRRYPKLY